MNNFLYLCNLIESRRARKVAIQSTTSRGGIPLWVKLLGLGFIAGGAVTLVRKFLLKNKSNGLSWKSQLGFGSSGAFTSEDSYSQSAISNSARTNSGVCLFTI